MNVFMGNAAGKGGDEAGEDREEDGPAEAVGSLADLGANLSYELDIPLDLREKLLNPETLAALGCKRELGRDEVPDDIHAFFGHPLTSDGMAEGGHASALAILHEYQNLPAIDRTEVKAGDKLENLTDILNRTNEKKETGAAEYLSMLDTEMDDFFDRDLSVPEDLSTKVMNESQTQSFEAVGNQSFSPSTDPMFTPTEESSSTGYEDSNEFPTFRTSEADALSLTTDIKQEGTLSNSTNGGFLDNNNDADVLLADYSQSCLAENSPHQSQNRLQKKQMEVNNNCLGGLVATQPENTTYPSNISNRFSQSTGNEKKSHHDQFAEFLLHKQAELQRQKQEQEVLRQQQLELLKQEIRRMSQITAQAQRAHSANEENAISQALQAQNQSTSLPKLTAETVQGIINNLPPSPNSPEANGASDSVVNRGHPEAVSDFQKQPDANFGSSTPSNTSPSSVSSYKFLAQGNTRTISRQASSPVTLGPPKSPINPHLTAIPPQSPVNIRKDSPHLPSSSPVPQSPVQRTTPVLFPQSPAQQFQAPSPQTPTSPMMQRPRTPVSRPITLTLQPSQPRAGPRPVLLTALPQSAKSLVFPSPTRPNGVLQPKISLSVPESPSMPSKQRSLVSSVKVTMQSLLNTTPQETQLLYQQSQQSPLNNTLFSRGVNGSRLPTAQVRPMPPNAITPTSPSPSTNVPQPELMVPKPAKRNKSPKNSSPKTSTASKMKAASQPKAKAVTPKSSKAKRKKPSHLVSPMSKVVLPQNGISITHEPVSSHALSKLQRPGPPPLLQVYPQQALPSPPPVISPSTGDASPSLVETLSTSNSTPADQTSLPSPVAEASPTANVTDKEMISGVEDTDQKPSESTKKIIKALNEKYTKKPGKKVNNATNEKVSIGDLNEIIKHSIDKKTPTVKSPDGFVYDPTDICRGLGNIPLKPSLLGDPNVSRFGVPRFHKRIPWQKLPLHARTPLLLQQDVQATQQQLQPQQSLQNPMDVESDEATIVPKLSPSSHILTPMTLGNEGFVQSQLQQPKVEDPAPVTRVIVPTVPASPKPHNTVQAASTVYSRSTSLIPQGVVPANTNTPLVVTSTVDSTLAPIPAPTPKSAPVRLTPPAFPQVPTPASPTSPLPSAPLTPSSNAAHTPTANNCPTEPFGSMSLESLTRPTVPNHRVPKATAGSSPVRFTPGPSYNPDTGSNVVVIMPQAGYNCPVPTIPLPQAPPAPLQPAVLPPYHADLKSPDSGFNESCVSPLDASGQINDNSVDASSSKTSQPEASPSKSAVKRRRSSAASGGSKSGSSGGISKIGANATVIPKLDLDLSGYKYYMETNTSSSQRIEDDRITYLNKGQFYGVTLEYTPITNRLHHGSTVKSLIIVVFRDEKCVEDELKSWEFWHSRQHSVKHRIMDIDTKNSSGILPNSIEEVAHNAVTIMWRPLEEKAKVSIAINCLSTDFSNQKGVKGLPLHVQIDTFEETKDTGPVHRGYCQVKVFCDKGAERKARDEEKRKEAKSKGSDGSVSMRRRHEEYHAQLERSEFYPMENLTKQAVLFNPIPEYEENHARILGLDMETGNAVITYENAKAMDGDDLSPTKRLRRESSQYTEPDKVLLYVREAHETVFTALLLLTPSLTGLAQAIEEKYSIPATAIKNVYKRSRKGIIVKMDDNIIKHYSNESTFVISTTKTEEPVGSSQVIDVTLAEINS